MLDAATIGRLADRVLDAQDGAHTITKLTDEYPSMTIEDSYAVQDAGGRAHQEYWIPAEDLSAFNDAIVGEIEVVAEFR